MMAAFASEPPALAGLLFLHFISHQPYLGPFNPACVLSLFGGGLELFDGAPLPPFTEQVPWAPWKSPLPGWPTGTLAPTQSA